MNSHTERGRPRVEGTDEAILEAALDQMARRGYARMSVEAVAAQAGVSKPTVYLRHPSKAALATAALAYLRERRGVPDLGSLRDDLVAELRGLQQGIGRRYGMAMVGTVLAEEHDTPELLEAFRARVVEPRRERFREILERGRARGEFSAEADLDAATATLVGSLYAQYLRSGTFPDDWPERVVGLVLEGLAAR